MLSDVSAPVFKCMNNNFMLVKSYLVLQSLTSSDRQKLADDIEQYLGEARDYLVSALYPEEGE